jgi:hypothetical protein
VVTYAAAKKPPIRLDDVGHDSRGRRDARVERHHERHIADHDHEPRRAEAGEREPGGAEQACACQPGDAAPEAGAGAVGERAREDDGDDRRHGSDGGDGGVEADGVSGCEALRRRLQERGGGVVGHGETERADEQADADRDVLALRSRSGDGRQCLGHH